jgi:hypothetical protein
MSIVPAMVTSPVARITTGVFAAFLAKVTVTPAGIFTVVKLKIPLSGTSTLAVGTNAPSAPVLPLLNTAQAAPGINIAMPKTAAAHVLLRCLCIMVSPLALLQTH